MRAATEIGARLGGGYDLLVSTGAQRATQTLACFLAALGERVAGGVIVEAGLRSGREKRWREAYEQAGSGELEALRTADPELVEEDSAALGAALGRVLDALADEGRAPVVGHSPTNEAAVFGLTGQIVGPISKAQASYSSPTIGLSAGDPGLRPPQLLAARTLTVIFECAGLQTEPNFRHHAVTIALHPSAGRDAVRLRS